MKRERWNSELTFILAAVGSAVGLGNVWRFPGLCYEYGGGAFLIAYVFAMAVVGLPILMTEIALGRKTGLSAPAAMRSLDRRTEAVGWAATLNSFLLLCYYAAIIGWVICMIFKAFEFGEYTGRPDAASGIFMRQVLRSRGLGEAGGFEINPRMLGALAVSWAIIYLCIKDGIKSISKVIKPLIAAPVLLLAAMAASGLAAPNGAAGLALFFKPDFSRFGDIKMWAAAFSQAFLSMSVMLGVMFAYGSFLKQRGSIIKYSVIIAASDLLISVLSGVVLYTTLSAAGRVGQISSSGVTTAFVIYPMALATVTELPALNAALAVMFYLTLLTLAVDSAFSMVEAVAAGFIDRFGFDKRRTFRAVVLAAAAVSVLYSVRAAVSLVDISDFFVSEINLLVIGALEMVAIGWIIGTKAPKKELGIEKSRLAPFYDFLIKFFCPASLAVLAAANILSLGGGYGGYPAWAQLVFGYAASAVLAAAAALLSRKRAAKG